MYFVAVPNQNIEQEQTKKGQHCRLPAFWGCCMPCPQAPLPASWAIWQSNADKAVSATQLCKSACVSLVPCAVLFLDTFFLKTVPPTPADRIHCPVLPAGGIQSGKRRWFPGGFHSIPWKNISGNWHAKRWGHEGSFEGKGSTKGTKKKLIMKNSWELWKKGKRQLSRDRLD